MSIVYPIVLAFFVLSCASSANKSSSSTAVATDQTSPQSLVVTYLSLMSQGLGDAAADLVATEDELSLVFDCPSDAGMIDNPVEYEYRERVRELAQEAKSRGLELAFVEMENPKKEESVGVGDEWNRCRAKAAVLMLKMRVHYTVRSQDGDAAEDTDIKLIRINDRWFFRKPFKPRTH
ncbi:MAG: hypothetical protein IPL19_21650 [Sandaracinaceae bacterium]|nr:hypothetical protein [Sandaracinaceae bacterium]